MRPSVGASCAGGNRRPANREPGRKGGCATIRRRARPGDDEYALHGVRRRRARGGAAADRTLADPAGARLGGARPHRDLSPARSGFVRAKPKSCKTNYWRCNLANGWTSERRARQAALIQRWKPWERSTGPKTPEGKARSRNAFKDGWRAQLRELSRLLREQEQTLGQLESDAER